MSSSPPTARDILRFWLPLAATWLMMAAEGPYLAAVVARLPEPTLGLAAYGVAVALAVLLEAPVIMLLSASTALVEDALSYRRLRAFAHGLNGLSTLALLLVVTPPVHVWLTQSVIGLPEEVARLTYGALWAFLPWPAAIGYRRFWQGVLIRAGRTRLVAAGTVVRLVAMSAAALALALLTDLAGPTVGAAALSCGVVVEATASRWMARDEIRAVLHPEGPGGSPPDPREADSGTEAAPGFAEIARFYVPLLLTSLVGIAVQPLLIFFMGRAPSPVESLAVFPVVHSLGFVFRSVGLSFQDAVIALAGRGAAHYAALRRFAIGLGGGLAAVLALIAFTPLSDVWFVGVSGLDRALAELAVPATRALAPVAFFGVILSLQRGVLIRTRRTGPVVIATATELVGVAAVFAASAWWLGWAGVTAAFTGLTAGRIASNAYLMSKVRRAREAGAGAPPESTHPARGASS